MPKRVKVSPALKSRVRSRSRSRSVVKRVSAPRVDLDVFYPRSRGRDRGALQPAAFAPTSRSRTVMSMQPQYLNTSVSNPGGVRVRHREYVTELYAQTASIFELAFSSGINPGLPQLFPWLSNTALQYESYKFYRLRFFVATEQATTVVGSLLAAIDYDASDPPPSSKLVLMSYDCSVRCAPWEDLALVANPAELHKLGPQRYVRSGAVASTDVKTYDCGNVFIGNSGIAAPGIQGEIYVEYDVEFYTPQLNISARAAVFSAHIVGATVSRAAPFGTGAITGVYGGVLIAPTVSGTTLGVGTPGQYLLVIDANGTVFNDTLPTATVVAGSGATISPIYALQTHNTAATEGFAMYRLAVNRAENISGGKCVSSGTVTFDYAASCTTMGAVIVRLAQYATANN